MKKQTNSFGYYVYTPVDGEEDGKFSNYDPATGKYAGISFEEAIALAKGRAETLKEMGIESSAYVNEVETSNTVWSCNGETATQPIPTPAPRQGRRR